jgi:hypothetical protein
MLMAEFDHTIRDDELHRNLPTGDWEGTRIPCHRADTR